MGSLINRLEHQAERVYAEAYDMELEFMMTLTFVALPVTLMAMPKKPRRLSKMFFIYLPLFATATLLRSAFPLCFRGAKSSNPANRLQMITRASGTAFEVSTSGSDSFD